jgi:transcriptional regulator with XRE-family HTH domain
MDSQEFKRLRKKLGKNQRQMAQLLAVSLKAVHSYEQGWRTVPPAVARQVYFLVSRLGPADDRRPAGTSRPPRGAQGQLPGLAVSQRRDLLVHQRDHLRRHRPEDLGR